MVGKIAPGRPHIFCFVHFSTLFYHVWIKIEWRPPAPAASLGFLFFPMVDKCRTNLTNKYGVCLGYFSIMRSTCFYIFWRASNINQNQIFTIFWIPHSDPCRGTSVWQRWRVSFRIFACRLTRGGREGSGALMEKHCVL